MKNLAHDETCDIDIRQELEAAGITVKTVERPRRSEVPYTLVGELGGWSFQRAWYYWIANAPEGKGIPENSAEELNRDWRKEVRVVGFAGGTDVQKWLSSHGTIDKYHIDTQEGLNAFADLVRLSAE